MDDSAIICSQCGASTGAPTQQPMGQPVPQPAVAPIYAPAAPADYDHTAEFDPKEISEGKVYALAIYLIPLFGVLYALIGATGNRFTNFHVRTWLKLQVVTMLSAFCCIIPILGWIVAGVWSIINFILTLICFFNVCSGKAIDPPIIRGLGFLK
jgi:uncharacterized membrane protein